MTHHAHVSSASPSASLSGSPLGCPSGKMPSTRASRADFWQALTGTILIVFILMHSLFVSSALISPKLEDALAWLLQSIGIAYIVGPAVLVLLFWHFWLAARKMPLRQGELCTFWQHCRAMRHRDTWLWLVQVASGILLLLLASIHVCAMSVSWPHSAAHSAERLHGGWLPFYLVLLPVLHLHLGMGFYRLGVKYGFITSACRAHGWKYACVLMGTLLTLGLLSLLRHYFLPA